MKQGTKIPVQTIVNNTVSVQFVDAVLELEVTPQITAEGNVYHGRDREERPDEQATSSSGHSGNRYPIGRKKVTVNDGATVVIGGIIVTNQQTDIETGSPRSGACR